MTQPFIVYVGTTSVRIPIGRDGKLPDGSSLGNFVRNVLEERDWDPKYNAWVSGYRYTGYDSVRNEAIIPRYALDALKQHLAGYTIEERILVPVEPTHVNLKMKKNIEPRPEQVEIIEFMSSDLEYKPIRAIPGLGKGLTHGTPIKVPGGWINIEDLKVGDTVTAWDGTPSKVTGVYPQGIKQVYRVTFRDGRYLDTDDVHLWTVITEDMERHRLSDIYDITSDTVNSDLTSNSLPNRRSGVTSDYIASEEFKTKYGPASSIYKIETMSTLSMMKTMDKRRVYIPHNKSEQIEDAELPIHPYVLGALLGDGSLSEAISIATDEWVIDKIGDILGCSLSRTPARGCQCGRFSKIRHITLYNAIESLGLKGHRAWEKFIPKQYLEGSHQQRLELLRGLMDTDGTSGANRSGRNGVIHEQTSHNEYSTTSEQLALDVQYLARSLGAQCKITRRTTFYTYKEERKPGRSSYRVRIRYPWMSELFSLPRKKDRMKTKNQYANNWKLQIMSVIPLLEKEECTCISIDHPDKLYIAGDFIVTHNTLASHFTMANLQHPTLIVLSTLVAQWYQSLRKFMKLSTHEIFVVQGYDALKKLWEAGKNGYRPKVIIISARTLFLYTVERADNYKELPTYQELQQFFGIGIKIMDEVHLGFNTNTRIDLFSNVKHNIYLSATYMRNSNSAKRIFRTVFPPDKVYGSGFSKKYSICHMVQYGLGIYPGDLNKFRTPKGYNHALYENFIGKHNKYFSLFFNKLLLMADMYFLKIRKPEQKLLILCQTKKFAEAMCNGLTKALPKTKCHLFFSGDKKYGKEEIFVKNDIIVSTHKSCGVGRDIKNLKTCINTVSYSSEPMAIQVFGRLRELPGEETIFIDMWNHEVPSHYHHKRNRTMIYRERALKCNEFNI